MYQMPKLSPCFSRLLQNTRSLHAVRMWKLENDCTAGIVADYCVQVRIRLERVADQPSFNCENLFFRRCTRAHVRTSRAQSLTCVGGASLCRIDSDLIRIW